MRFIEPSHIFNATNGGLDIILHYYPQAQKSVDNHQQKFKIRETEKTESCSLKKQSDGNWVVTDFGNDQKPRNGIMVCMEEENCDFVTALNLLAERYQVVPNDQVTFHKAEITHRDATPEEIESVWDFKIKDSFSDMELSTLFAEKILSTIRKEHTDSKTGVLDSNGVYSKLAGICRKLHFHPVESYTVIKDRKATTIASTENYPIFLIDEKGFKKIYQPKNPDKSRRFIYYGEKEKDFIHGLSQCLIAYQELQKEVEYNYDDDESNGEPKIEKLKEIILCSGGSDALNVAALGYHVIWLNSESAKLSQLQYTQLARITEQVYNLPDIDTTGQKTAHELALTHLEIKTIVLPAELKEKKDSRGYQCKDVRDYFRYHGKHDFADLLRVAMPYRFWDTERQYTRDGKFKKLGYSFNNVHAYNFFAKNGFSRLKSEGEKNGYVYIRIEGNTVSEIEPNDIKNFIHKFLELRREETDLRNTFYRSTQLSESSLSNLPQIEVDFTDYDKESQFLFFENKTWRITKDQIEEFKPGEVSKYIWQEEVIPFRIKKLDPLFEINQDPETDDFDITIKNDNCLFFRYLINTSRVHWRKELEIEQLKYSTEETEKYLQEHKFNIAGPLLSEEEKAEQKLHLINKIYSIGYLLHRYKDPSRPWCIYAMDNKINEDGGSYGGSGKSIAFEKAIRKVLRKSFYLGGRNPKLTDNPHIYDGLTEHHRYVLIDDADEYLNFKFFFDALTGELKVNPKNVQPYSIPFEKVGKFAITSNFTLRNIDPSTERRVLYTVFSDYYHQQGQTADYLESRSPKDDFGKNLFMEFTNEEWNLFYNFMAQCLQFYLNHDKINPPMDNVSRRNLQTEMTLVFQEWADVFFSEEGQQRDKLIPKKEVFEQFIKDNNMKWTTNKFSRAIKAWCTYHKFTYNPKELLNSSARLIRGVEGKATEMIYIQTKAKVDPSALAEKLPF